MSLEEVYHTTNRADDSYISIAREKGKSMKGEPVNKLSSERF